MKAKEWAEKGKMISVLDKDIFVIDKGTSENTLVILHGYATSSIDYYKVLPELSKHFRVIIQDFVGFGFSEKPTDYYYNILDQTDVTLELWKTLELKNITLLSHNYGASVSFEILTRNRTSSLNLDIQKLIFLNNTFSFDFKDLSKKYKAPLKKFYERIQLMFTSYSFFKMKIKEFYFDKEMISEDEMKEKWTLMDHKNGIEILDFLPNYDAENRLLWRRWFITLSRNTISSTIISGKNDIIFNENEANQFSEALNNSELFFIEECGHYPMLEKPNELIDFITNS